MVSTMLLDEIELLYALFIVLIHDLMLALSFYMDKIGFFIIQIA